ncbi:MAG: DNA replication and repair protein RecF [Synergistaceae bacterium]|jgi:DNA replication and repair protein RecF|nr:DNA replication and repair protein RecF [Synergistaceae bacterium]
MEFVETAWKGFRNLRPRSQRWQPGLNVISGSNGSGKTNLLESFNVLSGWGAFPTAGGRTSFLIAWAGTDETENGHAHLLGRAAGERDVEVQAHVGARMSLRAANERVTYSELRFLLPSLSFLPQDIELLDGPPSVRRLFLDKLCALSSPLYARRLAEYKQLVRQRTTLLRQSRRQDCNLRNFSASLKATALPLARLGGWVRGVRREIADLLAGMLHRKDNIYNDLCPFRVEAALELRGTAGLQDPVQDMAAALEAGLERERQSGTVLVGPHRDDLLFSCLGRPASLALSRGQKRRLVVAAILAAGLLIEAKLRTKPILLLDDVTAELDEEGRGLMGRALADTGWQVFVTSVEDPFDKVSEGEKTLWQVREGGLV